jgi:hypothetical protein
MSLDAKQMPIAELLSGDRQYCIPNFQRPYAWGFDEAFQLVEDLVSAWRRDDESYFLGSVVVVMADDEGRTVDVIDGQQRITTLSLMFAVLRHYYIGNDAQRKEISQLLEIPGNTIMGVEERPRLHLRDADQEFYEQYIVDDDLLGLGETTIIERDTTAKTNIKQNVDAIREGLLEGVEEGGSLEFLQFLLTKVFVVVVATNDYVSAHRVFGVLNTRGLPLTAADIFKAKVLGAIEPEKRDAYGEIWDHQIESVDGENPDAFFRHMLVAITKQPGKRALIEEFDPVFERYLPDGGAGFVDGLLVPYATVYRQLAGNGGGMPRELIRQLDLLNQYQSEDWKPVAMWILVNIENAGTQIELFAALERLFGVMTTTRQGSDVRSARMAGALRALADYVDDGRSVDPRVVMRIDDDLRKDAVYRMKAALAKQGPVRKILLTRAHLAGSLESRELPRSFYALPLIPTSDIQGVPGGVDVEYWKQRLGGLILSRGRTSDAAKKNTAGALARYFESKQVPPRTTATACPELAAMDTQALQQRHERIVELAAQYWGITTDSEGVNLTALTESELLQMTEGYSIRRSRRVSLADVVRVGIISPGDVFVWRRPMKGDVFRVKVTDTGALRLPDGTEVDSPSAAVAELAGSSASALDAWVRESDGKKMREMWSTYERRFTGK